MLNIACVQMNAGSELLANIEAASAAIREAAERLGHDAPRLIATPEMTSGLLKGRERALAAALPMAGHPAVTAFSALAKETTSWLLIGSISVRLDESGKDGEAERLANRSMLFAPDGQLTATYDKIHMFDVAVEDGQTYRESATYRPGEQAVLAELDEGVRLGMSICYDVRFGALYRKLAQAGADILSVPAAFTVPTGKAHWATLLRARAIENGCFVIAPGQTGEHEGGRMTYGHSMIIGPWGEVLAEAGSAPGIITASLDLAQIAKARTTIPSLTHDRPFF